MEYSRVSLFLCVRAYVCLLSACAAKQNDIEIFNEIK